MKNLLLAHNEITSTPQERLVPSRNGLLFCRAMGQGAPIIVIHGGPGLSQDYLLPQMERLAQNHFVIFYDQWGCGASKGEISPTTVSSSLFVEDIESVRKAFGLTKATIAGHSWGGLLAIQYAIAYPEAVDKMVLINSSSASSEGIALFMQKRMKRMAPYKEQIDTIQNSPQLAAGDPKTIELFYKMIFRTYCYNPEKADLLHLTMSQEAAVNGMKVNAILQEALFFSSFDFHPALQKLSIPTLIIHGKRDILPQVSSEWLHNSIKGSRYVLLEKCGHFPYVETPKRFFAQLESFLHAPDCPS